MIKTLKTIENLANYSYPNVYQASTKTHQMSIGSIVSFDSKQMIVELKQIDRDNIDSTTYQVKSLEKAINLLQRSVKDFKKYDRNRSYPYLSKMERDYKNYFLNETELTINFE